MKETTSLIVVNVCDKTDDRLKIRTTLLIGTSKYNPWHMQDIKSLKRNLQRPAIRAAKEKPTTWADLKHASDDILKPLGLRTYDTRLPIEIDGAIVINVDEHEVLN